MWYVVKGMLTHLLNRNLFLHNSCLPRNVRSSVPQFKPFSLSLAILQFHCKGEWKAYFSLIQWRRLNGRNEYQILIECYVWQFQAVHNNEHLISFRLRFYRVGNMCTCLSFEARVPNIWWFLMTSELQLDLKKIEKELEDNLINGLCLTLGEEAQPH